MGKAEATVTYSKDGHKKKQRRWLDGALKFDFESRFATLYAEDGKFISSGTIPADVEIQDDSEEFVLEAPSILVVISAITSGNDLPPPKADENARQLAAHRSGGAALRRSFAPPLASNPPTTTSIPPVQRSTLHPRGRVNQTTPTEAAAAPRNLQQRPPLKRQERTKEDIMRLLTGYRAKPAEIMHTSAPIAAPAPTENQNLAKRQRLLLSGENLPQQQRQQQHQASEMQSHRNMNAERAPQSNSQVVSRAAAPTVAAAKQMAPPPPRPVLPTTTSHQPANPLVSRGAPGTWNPRFNSNSSTAVLPVHPSAPGNPSARQLAAPAAPLPGTVYFPSAQESSKPVRRVLIPDRFTNPDAYRTAWEDSLYEEMTLKLADVAKDFHSAAAAVKAGASSSSSAAATIEAAMRKARVPYYNTCELFIWKNYPGKQNGGNFAGGRKKKKKGGNDDDDQDNGPSDSSTNGTTKPENVYLILKSGRAKNVDYSKGDLWILSNDPFMRSGFDPGQPGDRTKAPWVAVARSLWFGPNQDGKFEIEFLSARPSSLGRSTPVYAIKGPNASMELNILDLLKIPSLSALPLLRSILGAAPLSHNLAALLGTAGEPPSLTDNPPTDVDSEKNGKCPGSTTEAVDELFMTPAELAESVIQKFKLNAEQAHVVRHVATWANSNSTPSTNTESSSVVAPPVCLVFGPFGCGKSSLLIAVLHLLLKLRNLAAAPADAGGNKQCGGSNPLSQSRILISAHTNVAVDRVLTGLLDSGCSDFLRVGPLRRIDRSLLPYSLHASESKSHANAAAELKDMLREGQGKMSPTEEAALRAELAAMAAGAERQRKKLLKTAPVVGVTCCSSLLPILENLTFDIVILDECSQIIEPLAMAPILRAKAKFLVAAGDPKQLPPVIANPPTSSSSSGFGLLRPLFVRLSDLGATPHLLRQQYRCHPALSAIPNAHFYQGRLLDGCSAEQRPSLLPGLPPAVFVDVRDGKEQYVMRSTANAAEAQAVVRVVEKALAAGVDPARLGVICFYRAQVQEVQNLLFSRASVLQAAVEKALQQKSSLAKQQDQLGFEEEERDLEENTTTTSSFTSIQVSTVDAFQGAEKDVIILTTATTTTRSGAFIADAARLNVALTRGKNNLVLVGCGQALDRSAPAFSALIRAARTKPGGYHIGNIIN